MLIFGLAVDAITHRGADEDTFLLCDNTEVVEIVEMGY